MPNQYDPNYDQYVNNINNYNMDLNVSGKFTIYTIHINIKKVNFIK